MKRRKAKNGVPLKWLREHIAVYDQHGAIGKDMEAC